MAARTDIYQSYMCLESLDTAMHHFREAQRRHVILSPDLCQEVVLVCLALCSMMSQARTQLGPGMLSWIRCQSRPHQRQGASSCAWVIICLSVLFGQQIPQWCIPILSSVQGCSADTLMEAQTPEADQARSLAGC